MLTPKIISKPRILQPNQNGGWSPALAVVSDGLRRVLRVVDWFGGYSDKPSSGQYLGSTGFVETAPEGVDVRGASADFLESLWVQTSFHNTNANATMPWTGAAISGNIAGAGLDLDIPGTMRVTAAASGTNTGYRWATLGNALRPRAGLCSIEIVTTPGDLSNRLWYLGFHPMTNQTIPGTSSSVFFRLNAGIFEAGYSNNGAVSYDASTFTPATTTTYVFERLFLTNSSVQYSIYLLSTGAVEFRTVVSSGIPSTGQNLLNGVVMLNTTAAGAVTLGWITMMAMGPKKPYFIPWS